MPGSDAQSGTDLDCLKLAATLSKTVVSFGHRGFKSHSLRRAWPGSSVRGPGHDRFLSKARLESALADPKADSMSLHATCERALAVCSEQEALIEALLMLSQGQRELDDRHPLDLAGLAAQILDSAAPRAAAGSVTVEVDLQRAPVSGDEVLLERLIGNLVDNAIFHNLPGGWVEVRTWAEAERVVLGVANSGAVVPADQVGGLLRPFQRGGPQPSGHGDGVGLGLSIVQAIASAHAADLVLSSRPHGGLDVEVRFLAEPSWCQPASA
jgi:signal transduction histidine kinase